MREPANAQKWEQWRPSQVPLLQLRPSRLLSASGSGSGGALLSGRETTGGTRLATGHRAHYRSVTHDGSQVGKKKRRKDLLAVQSPRGRGCWSWMRCGRLWAANAVRSGSGWPWNGTPAALSPGCWAHVGRLQRDGSGGPCQRSIAAARGSIRTSAKPTGACCRTRLTGRVRKAVGRPVSSKPSTVPYGSGVRYWCAKLARSVVHWRCIASVCSSALRTTITDSPKIKPPPIIL